MHDAVGLPETGPSNSLLFPIIGGSRAHAARPCRVRPSQGYGSFLYGARPHAVAGSLQPQVQLLLLRKDAVLQLRHLTQHGIGPTQTRTVVRATGQTGRLIM